MKYLLLNQRIPINFENTPCPFSDDWVRFLVSKKTRKVLRPDKLPVTICMTSCKSSSAAATLREIQHASHVLGA